MTDNQRIEKITEILFEDFSDEKHFNRVMAIITSYDSPEITYLMIFSLLLGTITPEQINDAYYSPEDFGVKITSLIQGNIRKLVEYIKGIYVEIGSGPRVSLERSLDVIAEKITRDGEPEGEPLFDNSKNKYFSRITELMVSPKVSKNIMLQKRNRSLEQLYLRAVFQIKNTVKKEKAYELTSGVYRRMINSLLDISYINNLDTYIGESTLYTSGTKRNIFHPDIDGFLVAHRNNSLFILNDSLLDNASTLFVGMIMSIMATRMENMTSENSETVRAEMKQFRNIVLSPYDNFSNKENDTFLTNIIERKNAEGNIDKVENNSILEYINSFMDHDKNVLIPMASPGMFFILTYYIIPEFINKSEFDIDDFKKKIIDFLWELKDQTSLVTRLIYNIQERVLSQSRSFEVIS